MNARISCLAALLLAFLYACDFGSAPGGGTGVDGLTLTGTIVDGHGAPVRGARVWLFPDSTALLAKGASAAPPAFRADSTLTDKAGRYVFLHLPAGRYALSASYTRHDSILALHRRGITIEDEDIELPADTLRPGGTLYVYAGGADEKAVAGATCEIPGSPWRAVSDADGYCVFKGIGAGDMSVRVAAPGRSSVTAPVTVRAGETSSGYQVSLFEVEWVRVAENGFSFYRPPGMEFVSRVNAIDGGGADYQSPLTTLNIQWSVYAEPSPFPDSLPGFSADTVWLDTNLRAVRYYYSASGSVFKAALTVQRLPFAPGENLGQYHFVATSSTAEGQEQAIQIIRSIRKEGIPLLQAPAAPALSLPLDGEDSVSLSNATLSWLPPAAGSGAISHYRIEARLDTLFSYTGYFSDTLPAGTTSWTVPYMPLGIDGSNSGKSLLDGRRYYWRVVAVGQDRSAYSPVRSFITTPYTPIPRQLTSPTVGAANVSLSPTLTWSLIPDNDFYQYVRVQVSTDSLFGILALNDSIQRPPFVNGQYQVIAGPLQPATRYFWRVLTVGQLQATSYSQARSFITVAASGAAPDVPQLMSPSEGQVVLSDYDSASFSWMTAGVGATTAYYHLQVATDSSFRDPMVNEPLQAQNRETGISTYRVALKRGRDYYWRAVAVGDGGVTPSVTRTFRLSVFPDD